MHILRFMIQFVFIGYGGYGLGYAVAAPIVTYGGYGGHLWKRDAEAEPQYYRGGYGYRGGYRGGYGGYRGRYGKRSADAEPKADPSLLYGELICDIVQGRHECKKVPPFCILAHP